MRFRILDAADTDGRAAWISLWQAWPVRDVMAHPDYARLFARPCDRVVGAVSEDGEGRILFPLILRPLSAEPWARPGERRWDAITPYGYGGPFAWGSGSREDASFWCAHAEWCRAERVVSTFARLSLFPDQIAEIPGPVEVRARNVIVPLEGGEAALWAGYDTKVRRWVRTAEAAGLEVEVDREGARLDAFLDVYAATMSRHGALAWYLFPRAFFETMLERLRGDVVFFHTLVRGEVVSSDLVLCAREHVYYFLGGTRAEAFHLGPNYLLKHRVATWAISEGKRWYVLGGGHDPEDGLYRYKRAFARHGVVPFRIAHLVHDEASCRELEDDRAAAAAQRGESWEPRRGFFPAYRG